MLKKRTRWLFWLAKGAWITLYPNIYYPDEVIDPSAPQYKGLVAHERKHIEQQRDHPKRWMLRWLYSWDFRFQVEIEAINAEIIATGHEYKHDIVERYANAMSSWRYFWCASKDEVRKALQ